MCGIIGFLGLGGAVKEAIEGLEALEYRGYDSAGISFLKDGRVKTIKSVGNISKLKEKVIIEDAHIAIGHTRWATHGGVTEANSHPHLSHDGRVIVVHNGIIENYKDLIDFPRKSETDTEVIPNLISKYMDKGLLVAVKEASKHLRGSYAFLAMSPLEPNTLVATRFGRQPLVIGEGKDFIYVSSDLPTARQKCHTIYVLEEGEFVSIADEKIDFGFEKEPLNLEIEIKPVTKEGYSTFMEKEIFEIPSVIEKIIKNYENIIQGNEFKKLSRKIKNARTVHITACGTAYHSGLVLAQLLESHQGVRTKTYIASELPFADAFFEEGDLGVVISQSGETADTLSAMQIFKEHGLPVAALCNVEGSSIARYCDFLLPTLAGTEIAVASTKAFIAQTIVATIVARQGIPPKSLISQAREVLIQAPRMKELAKEYRDIRSIFFLGKGLDATLALESALKVKEITYKHCEGFPSGELKHGTLALVDDQTLTIMLCTSNDEKLRAKQENAKYEVKARGSHTEEFTADNFLVGAMHAQLFSLYLAQELGLNPDQPRNLAKSVTVE
ncbi:MAG: glutamine--fructose-6-phosphate transaminase (isomerizing) [Firmicutes bacterium]|nr:glutamine--fructose-6-phosphate transaminase (isomerizing) [Bacillota bacterium]